MSNNKEKAKLEEELKSILGDDFATHGIVMEDSNTGEEFTFYYLDDFEFEDNLYACLINIEEEPEAILVKVVKQDDEDSFNYVSLPDDEYERVLAYYLSLEYSEVDDDIWASEDDFLADELEESKSTDEAESAE